MSASLVFPVSLPPPQRDQYSHTYEDNVSNIDFDLGAARQRLLTTVEPRLESVNYIFTQAEYEVFCEWWYANIKSGQEAFDIRLADNQGAAEWYTAHAAEPFQAAIDSTRYEWYVQLNLRIIDEGFGVRDPGTATLKAFSLVKQVATGRFVITQQPHALSNIAHTGKARMTVGATLYGLSTMDVDSKARIKGADLRGISLVTVSSKGELS